MPGSLQRSRRSPPEGTQQTAPKPVSGPWEKCRQRNRAAGDAAWATTAMLEPLGSRPTSSPFQPPANVHPGKQQVMAQAIESLPPMWLTQIEFLAPSFVLAQFQLLWVFEE